MAAFLVRRLASIVVLLVAATSLAFLVFNVLPSASIAGGRALSPRVRAELGLDRPVLVQFADHLADVFLRLDLGESWAGQRRPVLDQLLAGLPATVSLTAGAVVLSVVLGVLLGVVSATRRRSWLDRFVTAAAFFAVSAPVYWLGLLALYLLMPDIGLLELPLVGAPGSYRPLTEDPVAWIKALLLPWLVLSASFAAIYAQLVRGSLLEVLGEDYVRTARAKGLGERRVLLRHALRAALAPVTTIIGVNVGILLGGVVLVEQVFNLPGIGRMARTAMLQRDLPMIQGVVLFGAFFVAIANLLADVLQARLDPRVRA